MMPSEIGITGRSHRHSRSTGVHPYEKVLVWLIAIPVLGLPWAFGGTPAWAQFAALPFCVAAFIVALLPRLYGRDLTGGEEPYIYKPWLKLRKFPLFWLGIAFFVYVGIQMLNPAWQYVEMPTKAWYMHQIDYIHWLPHGVTGVPLRLEPPWFECVKYIIAMSIAYAVYIGVRSSENKNQLLKLIAINGILISFLSILQLASHADKIYWLYSSPNPYFWGSFINRNHASCYIFICCICCIYCAYYIKDKYPQKEKGLLTTWITGIISCIFSLAICGSRFSIVFLAGAIGIAATLIIKNWSKNKHRSPLIASTCLVIVCLTFGSFALYNTKISEGFDRIANIANSKDSFAVPARLEAAKAGIELGNEAPLFGNGFGAFKFLFPKVQVNHSLLGVKDGRPTMWWTHAHNDYVETYAEVGTLGSIIITCGILYMIFRQRKNSIFAIICLVLTHCLIEFDTQIPAILLTLAVISTINQKNSTK